MTSNRTTTRDTQPARGVTLLELLIVMTIMLMVTAATIPVMMPALKNRRMREASRLVSGYFSAARARAIETGRPVGVMIERENGQPFALRLSYVEVPPPYSGDTPNSRASILGLGEIGLPGDSLWINNIRMGDRVQLNNQGTVYTLAGGRDFASSQLRTGEALNLGNSPPTRRWFLLTPATTSEPFTDVNMNGIHDREPFRDDNDNGSWDAGEPFTDTDQNGSWTNESSFTDSNGNGVYDSAGQLVLPPPAAWPFTTGSVVPFQIIRQPVRSAAASLQLPEGACIDLVGSGVTASGTFGAYTMPMPSPLGFNPIITFAPNGGVDLVSSTPSGQLVRPAGTIFLLVGRRELMPDISTSRLDENLGPDAPNSPTATQYLLNFWVAISPQSGQITVAENANNLGPRVDGMNMNTVELQKARAFAVSGQSAGGR